jgi:hypothetical protein
MRAERQRKLLPDYLSYFIHRRPCMFKSRPGGQLFWLRFFMVFLSPSMPLPRQCPKL